MPHPDNVSRRDFLVTAGTASAAGLVLGSALPAAAQKPDNPVVVENQKLGTTDWLLKNPKVTPPHPLWHMFGLRCPWIEGFCSHATIRAGQTLSIYVNTDPESRFTLDIYRTGYYGGKGGRLMTRIGPLQGTKQPTPEPGFQRAIICDWKTSIELPIPGDWLSGVYVGKLTELREGIDSYVIFIVRDDRKADMLFQCSDMTWQAYNRWPFNFSLYCKGESDAFIGSGVDVGINRPFGKYTQMVDQPLSCGSSEYFLTEFPIAYWAEQQGYDISYISNWDTHYGAGLDRAGGFLSIGHDEYWTQEMYDNVKGAIDRGTSVAFLSGNAVFCKIRLKPAPDGRADRIFERDGRFNPREKWLMGAMSTGPVIGGADWTCRLPDHWLFEGTGMREGDSIRNLVGWEYHGDPADIPGLEVVASGPTDGRRFPDRQPASQNQAGVYTATIYPGPRGNFVFNAATCWWADGVSEPPGYLRSDWYGRRNGPDPRVQRITKNLLDRMKRPT